MATRHVEDLEFNYNKEIYPNEHQFCGNGIDDKIIVFNGDDDEATRRSQVGEDGKLKYLTLSCAQGGKPKCKDKNPLRGKPSIKIDCKARINATFCKDMCYSLSLVVLDHNHVISPKKSRFYTCNKRLGLQVRKRLELNDQSGITLSKNFQSLVVEAGGYENLPFGEKECRNYIDKIRRIKLGERDAQAIHNYIFQMQKMNPNFLYSLDLDGEGRLKNIFWENARSRAAYDSFNDVITFDTTYLTNRYDMPFAPFVGINHHGQSTLMGRGLVSNEDTESFVWLFKTWLGCMYGQSPKAIITYQCKAMRAAVQEVSPKANHYLCRWHIMKKVLEKLSEYADYKAIKKLLKKIVYDSLRIDEFEEKWKDMIELYNHENNGWLKSLCTDIECWVPVFVRRTFLAGMSSSQHSESMNAFFDDYIHSKTTLQQFVVQYDKALQRKVKNEKQLDFHSFNSNIPLITALYMEKQMQEVCMHGIFKKFQDKIRDLIYCNAALLRKREQFIHLKSQIIVE